MFVGTPTNLSVPHLEKPLGKPRPPFMAPKGTKNLAVGKAISSTDEFPIIGDLEMITDGENDAVSVCTPLPRYFRSHFPLPTS